MDIKGGIGVCKDRQIEKGREGERERG